MDEPGGERRQDDGDDIFILQAAQRRHEGRGLAQRPRGRGQKLERQQHQAEPDRDTAEMARFLLLAREEGDDTGADGEWRHPAEVERQHLGRDRGADIGTQHDRKRDGERDQAAAGEGGEEERRCGARLQYARDGEAAGESGDAVARAGGDGPAQRRPEGACEAGAHHTHAPQQQTYAAQHIQESFYAMHDCRILRLADRR